MKKSDVLKFLMLVIIIVFIIFATTLLWKINVGLAIMFICIIVGTTLGIITHLLRYSKTKFILPSIVGVYSIYQWLQVVFYKPEHTFMDFGPLDHMLFGFLSLIIF